MKENSEDLPIQAVYLVIGRYLTGGNAEYLNEGSIRREDREVFFDVSRSRTNMSYSKLGLVVNF